MQEHVLLSDKIDVEDEWTTKMLRKIQKAYDGWRSIYGEKYQKIRFFVTESDKGSASITR